VNFNRRGCAADSDFGHTLERIIAPLKTARIAAIRELLDRGYGRPRQAVEVSAPAGDPIQELFDEIDALNRKRIYKQVPNEPA
jgi:hypothetical protein